MPSATPSNTRRDAKKPFGQLLLGKALFISCPVFLELRAKARRLSKNKTGVNEVYGQCSC